MAAVRPRRASIDRPGRFKPAIAHRKIYAFSVFTVPDAAACVLRKFRSESIRIQQSLKFYSVSCIIIITVSKNVTFLINRFHASNVRARKHEF